MNIENTVLAGDTGGTKTLLALYEAQDGQRKEIKKAHFNSRDYERLEDIIEAFLAGETGRPTAAAFGIPGPVVDGVVRSTNLPWVIEEKTLSQHVQIPHIKLVNDLAATAHALPSLTEDEIVTIKKGETPKHPERYVVLAPGTGLGQSFLMRHRGKSIVIASEGGHTDFAPANEVEAELYLYLYRKFGHVSYERTISGSGLPNIFDFLIDIKNAKPSKATLEQMQTQDKAAVISTLALDALDPVCEEALHIFVSILGTKAGNLALNFLSDGGVYLGGGIPYKILPKLSDGAFVRSFLNKGRMQWVLDNIPVHVITNNQAALKGAAQIAFEINHP